MEEEKNKKNEKKEGCPLCQISEDTIKKLKEAKNNGKPADK